MQAHSENQSGRPLRLLVVDDDQLNQNMIDLILSPRGYELDFAGNGAEALEAIRTRQYDLVFMDLVLPDMNGREVCREVRAWEAGKSHLPIVALTAYDLPGQPLELLKAGMDDYVFKPFDLRGLSRIINIYAGGDGYDSFSPAGSGKPGQPADAPILDYEASLRDFSNDVEGYKRLLRDFVASLPVRLEKMERAQNAEDMDALGRECHSLKGVSAGLGALHLSRLAMQLGHACAGGQTARAADLLRQMQQAVQELHAEAHVFLESYPAGAFNSPDA